MRTKTPKKKIQKQKRKPLLLTVLTLTATLKRRTRKYKKIIITLTSLIFFLLNYQICNFFYPLNDEKSIENWWALKIDIYLFVISLFIIGASFKPSDDNRIKKIQTIINQVFMGFAISNFIDRRFLKDNIFDAYDLLIVLIIIFISNINLVKISQNARGEN